MRRNSRYRNPILTENDLVIVISQSGETADTLAAMREAKRRGCRVLAIVNVVGSSVAREADDVIYTWAGPEIAVATTKAYSTQLQVLYLLALHFATVRGKLSDEAHREIVAEMLKIPQKIEAMLQDVSLLQGTPRRTTTQRTCSSSGAGSTIALALEASLETQGNFLYPLRSICCGRAQHGTISLMEEGTNVVALATQKRLFEKTLSNIRK